MSKKKHSITYTKPEEPKFLREFKVKAQYEEGPTLVSKRAAVLIDNDDYDRECLADEEPVIVVLKQGDMAPHELEDLKPMKEKEETNTRADLTKRIIFHRKLKHQNGETSERIHHLTTTTNKKAKRAKLLLSFDNEDDQ